MLLCLLCCHLRFGRPLLPWLVPLSGVAGIADDLISLCCPVCCVVLYQPRLCYISLHTSFHLRFGRPLLLPWLIPSSGVAGIADDLISLCCPVCCVVLYQPRLCYISLHTSFHLRFGRPLLLPWLVPSSGVAGIADDLISLCCPVCCVVLYQPRLCHISLTRIIPP